MNAGKVLVIGYGNTLMGDDAVGPRIAEEIAARNWPCVEAIALPQLVPELAEELSTVALAIFVDARIGRNAGSVEATPLVECSGSVPTTHGGDPRALLSLAKALYGQAPTAWLVTIAGEDFSLGRPLSPRVERDMAATIERIETLIASFEQDIERHGRAPACTKSA